MLHWNIDPTLLHLGPLELRWYGLFFGGGFLLGYFWVVWFYRREGKPERNVDNLLVVMAISTMLGARLGHFLFYDFKLFLSDPLVLFRFWEGGLASHGSGIGIVIGAYLYSRKHPQEPLIWVLSRLCIPASMIGGLIRIGNFFNSEILGIPTTLPWGVVFERFDYVPRHPAQLYEAIAYLSISGLLQLFYLKGGRKGPPIRILALYWILIFTVRFFVEFIKINQVDFESSLPLNMGQILSIPLILLGFVFFIWPQWIQKKVS